MKRSAYEREPHRTHTRVARANDKHAARLNVMRDILARIERPQADRASARVDPQMGRVFSPALLRVGWLAT